MDVSERVATLRIINRSFVMEKISASDFQGVFVQSRGLEDYGNALWASIVRHYGCWPQGISAIDHDFADAAHMLRRLPIS